VPEYRDAAGHIRLTSGSLVSGAELDLAANQIYPTTDSTFTLASATTLSFAANGAPPLAPYSAGGTLNIYAPNIIQGGTLRAPTGTINLGWSSSQTEPLDGLTIAATKTLLLAAGGDTSVSADGETVL
jgi:hypothetical protein